MRIEMLPGFSKIRHNFTSFSLRAVLIFLYFIKKNTFHASLLHVNKNPRQFQLGFTLSKTLYISDLLIEIKCRFEDQKNYESWYKH